MKKTYNQVHECDVARLAIVHEPSMETFVSMLHPSGNLYEARGFSRRTAKQSHRNLTRCLRENGIEVKRVRDILDEAAQNEETYEEVVDMAMSFLTYEFTGPVSDLTPERMELLGDKYKRHCLLEIAPDELSEIIVTAPKVQLTSSSENTPLVVDHVEYSPLGNLVFTRDQQIVTPKGVVLARLAAPQRDNETKVLKKCFQLLNIPIAGEVAEPGTLEGGDFFPLGPDLCLIGVGLRTNMAAVQQGMDEGWFGTSRVVAVVDEGDLSQDRMHLDTVFNIVSPGHALILDRMLAAGNEPSMQRKAVVYTRDTDGQYQLERELPFEQFLMEEGFQLIPITDEQQSDYMPNFVNIGQIEADPENPAGEGKSDDDTRAAYHIVSVHPGLEQLLRDAQITESQVVVHTVDYQGITKMYGAAHCSTQVFRHSVHG